MNRWSMGHVLLISDASELNHLLAINLKVYTNTTVTTKPNCQEAIQFMQAGPSLDAVLLIPGTDETYGRFLIYLQTRHATLPLLLVGKVTLALPAYSAHLYQIESVTDFKAIIKRIAAILEITAKEMAVSHSGDFYPLPLHLLMNAPQLPVDLYIESQDPPLAGALGQTCYMRVHEREQPLSGTLKFLSARSVETVYVVASERLKMVNSVTAGYLTQLQNQQAPLSDKLPVVEQSLHLLAEQFFARNEDIEQLSKLATTCVQTIEALTTQKSPMSDLLALLLKSQSHYSYIHSVLSAHIASSMLDNLLWATPEQKAKITYIALFHDLPLLPLYDKYPQLVCEQQLISYNELRDSERAVVEQHAMLAAEAVNKMKKVPLGTDLIIRQHHGMLNGVGFREYPQDEISPLTKVFMISEEFVNYLLEGQRTGRDEVYRSDLFDHIARKYPRPSFLKILEVLESLREILR